MLFSVFEGGSQALCFGGSYSDYEEDYKRRDGNKKLNHLYWTYINNI